MLTFRTQTVKRANARDVAHCSCGGHANADYSDIQPLADYSGRAIPGPVAGHAHAEEPVDMLQGLVDAGKMTQAQADASRAARDRILARDDARLTHVKQPKPIAIADLPMSLDDIKEIR